ncbi:conserved hypothetical protein [Talaromyces stipitatus ATCC 10500]|uniref:Aminoglycoside phosphotransferase domain-containing protein n=1 Tax=Talaromyces stipitatus (strain ATCC 10500 / CBS 375.48 / QM 6759 / NRRL 1006) TaxID=441959 RepID=B8LU52_TALSN|nr:uncharacterized protein TSTA_060210 [Talaromyces stipitatus ATCC 10500]EED22524.1 conserved hypothetical protein [Talaromyces stipitatus ATCC 10500]
MSPTRAEEKRDCPPDDSDSEDISRNLDSTARIRALTFSSSPPQRQHRSGRQFKRTDDSTQESLDFCTQRCLLSLKTGDWLDENCPNVDRHRNANSKHHQIHVSDFLRLLKWQLDNDLDHYCTPCGESGIRGFPFKISLMPFGYTILGKGTTDRRWPIVRQEENVYQVLRSVQGSAVPVFLGTIDIEWIYFHEGFRITHFLILSWGGDQFNPLCCEEERWNEYQRTKEDIRRLGVRHGDLHESNILWNTELGRVQFIDFHKAELSWTKKRKRDATNSSRPRRKFLHLRERNLELPSRHNEREHSIVLRGHHFLRLPAAGRAPFKVTLTEYGYTFVANGVQKANERDLAHEINMYSYISPLQERNIPVYLGRIAVTRPYSLVIISNDGLCGNDIKLEDSCCQCVLLKASGRVIPTNKGSSTGFSTWKVLSFS